MKAIPYGQDDLPIMRTGPSRGPHNTKRLQQAILLPTKHDAIKPERLLQVLANDGNVVNSKEAKALRLFYLGLQLTADSLWRCPCLPTTLRHALPRAMVNMLAARRSRRLVWW